MSLQLKPVVDKSNGKLLLKDHLAANHTLVKIAEITRAIKATLPIVLGLDYPRKKAEKAWSQSMDDEDTV